ncbi:MAG: hypothetical protein AABW58_00850 [Nanoarchaeota archaeon]
MADKKEDSKDESDLENLAAAFEGFEVSRYIDEHGIDPSRISRYRETKTGEIIFLCAEDSPTGERIYYTLRASPKTKDWKKIVSEYKKE